MSTDEIDGEVISRSLQTTEQLPMGAMLLKMENEQILKAELKPLYDTNHECTYVRDEEETESYYSVKCIHCPRGRLIRK